MAPLVPAAQPATSHGTAVEVRDLVVRYGELTAVDGISLTADYGEIVALLGPNGAGKTTTVEALEGYRSPIAGSLRVAGYDPSSEHRQLVSHIGVVLQRGGVYPMMSPERVLRLFASYYEQPLHPGELLARLDLARVARTPYKRLSGGEQQRLAVALALVGRPKVAFLDEPTAGVDPVGRLAVREVVNDLRSDGVCVVLTSHELEEVERLADRIVVLNRGHVVASGRAEELAGGREEIRFATEQGVDTTSLAALLGAAVVETSSGRYVAALAPSPQAVASLTSWLAERNLVLGDLQVGRERLEDVFIRLVSGESETRHFAEEVGADGAGRRRGTRR